MGQNGIILTERDVALLLSVYKYRYLSTGQVQALHFPSAQTALRRIRVLARGGFLTPFRAPGVEEQLVTLTERGAQTVAEHLLVPLPELGWTKRRGEPRDHYFLKHFLAVSDFRIALTRASAAVPDLTLLGFIPDYVGERTATGGLARHIRDVTCDIEEPRHKVAHTPDAVFALARGGKPALFFLEVDRGTEVLTDPARGFLKTLRFYLGYLQGEAYQRYRDDFRVAESFRAFRVLVVTATDQRLANIRTVGGHLRAASAHVRRFIWLTTLRAVSARTILSPIWVPLDPAVRERYAIIPTAAVPERGGGNGGHHAQGRDDPQPVVDHG